MSMAIRSSSLRASILACSSRVTIGPPMACPSSPSMTICVMGIMAFMFRKPTRDAELWLTLT